jgi:hypothetical protein
MKLNPINVPPGKPDPGSPPPGGQNAPQGQAGQPRILHSLVFSKPSSKQLLLVPLTHLLHIFFSENSMEIVFLTGRVLLTGPDLDALFHDLSASKVQNITEGADESGAGAANEYSVETMKIVVGSSG